MAKRKVDKLINGIKCNNHCALRVTGNHLGIVGSTMVGLHTGGCNTIAPNDGTVSWSLEFAGL